MYVWSRNGVCMGVMGVCMCVCVGANTNFRREGGGQTQK